MKNVITERPLVGNGTENLIAYAVATYGDKYKGNTSGINVCCLTVENDDSCGSVVEAIGIMIDAEYHIIVVDVSDASSSLIHNLRYSEIIKDKGYLEIAGIYDDKLIFIDQHLTD